MSISSVKTKGCLYIVRMGYLQQLATYFVGLEAKHNHLELMA